MTGGEPSHGPGSESGLDWFDAHCHLDDVGGGEDAVLQAVIGRARAAGVERMVTIGTDLATSRAAAGIAAAHEGVWAAVGVHPHDATTLTGEALDELEALASEPKVVAIGEIGLDYFRDLSPRDVQQEAFRRQLALARRLGVPVVIHMRDAHRDVFGILEEAGAPERLVFHCFSGGPADAARCLELGGYVSFAGNISYKNAQDLRDACAVVPLDRLLVETDAPYLAPVPHRGKPNEPAFVPAVGAAVAAATGVPKEEIASATSANAASIFGLGLALRAV
ncbi:MAG: TatD DNase family protein [Actinomycetota bacterium]|nr:TatD DNase family protein [Actinomycetota bacterium]